MCASPGPTAVAVPPFARSHIRIGDLPPRPRVERRAEGAVAVHGLLERAELSGVAYEAFHAAAAAIGRDRSFRSVDDLASVAAPTLIVPGTDERHPTDLAEALARTLPRGRLAPVTLSADLLSADDFARAFAPPIRDFLAATAAGSIARR